MGRGRAKAKQVKVARQLKYNSGGTDLDRLRAELGVGTDHRDGDEYDTDRDVYDDEDSDAGDDDDDETDEDAWGRKPARLGRARPRLPRDGKPGCEPGAQGEPRERKLSPGGELS